MRVLVTGSRGFVGCHVIDALARLGHDTVGCDLRMHPTSLWCEPPAPATEWRSDFRRLGRRALDGIDCIVHLAGFANEPSAVALPTMAQAVNVDGAVALATKARAAGVQRFVFASSCSLYEGTPAELATEQSRIQPSSIYAKSKMAAEQGLDRLRDDSFEVVSLRLASAYGISPAMRLDLAVNAMIYSALRDGRIRIFTNPAGTRPLIAVETLGQTIATIATRSQQLPLHSPLNVGMPGGNHTFGEIAEVIRKAVPGAGVKVETNPNQPIVGYQVCFDRLREVMPSIDSARPFEQVVPDLVARFLSTGLAERLSGQERFNRGKTTVAYFQSPHAAPPAAALPTTSRFRTWDGLEPEGWRQSIGVAAVPDAVPPQRTGRAEQPQSRLDVPYFISDLPPEEHLAPYLQRMRQSRRLTNFGPLGCEIEHRLECETGRPAVAVASGTAALFLALAAAPIEPCNRTVILPSFNFGAALQASVQAGFTPKFIDIQPDFSISPRKLQAMLKATPDCQVVIATNFFGWAGNPAEIEQAVKRFNAASGRNVLCIFDSAHAYAARYAGRPIGAFGDLEIFSFSATKAIGGAEGGAIVTVDQTWLEGIKTARNYGTQDYAVVAAGQNGKLSEPNAAFILARMDRRDEIIAHRADIAAQYLSVLSEVSEIQLPRSLPPGRRSGRISWWCCRVGEPMAGRRCANRCWGAASIPGRTSARHCTPAASSRHRQAT